MQKFADIYFHLVLKHTSLGYNLYIFSAFLCTCSICHSKTKNRQRIIFVSSRAEKESRKKEAEENVEDGKIHGDIGR